MCKGKSSRTIEIPMTKKSPQPLLKKTDKTPTRKRCGLHLFEDFLSPRESKDAFDLLVDDESFPWDAKPEFDGEPLKEDTSEHDILELAKEQKRKRGLIRDTSNFKGLVKLGELSAKIEQVLGVRVSFVFCNKLQDRDHWGNWHKNGYAEHVCILTLGAKRRIEFKNNKTKEIEVVTPRAGDLYLLPLNLNETHTHRVCSAKETNPRENKTSRRLSFVFFLEHPNFVEESDTPIETE